MNALTNPLPLVLMLTLAACSTSDLTRAEKKQCVAYATAACAKLDSCVVRGVARRFGDSPTCISRLAAGCEANAGTRDSALSAGSLEGCINALPGADCGDFERDTLAACAPPQGPLGTGDACAFSSQCASTFCQIVTGTSCGTCQPLTSIGASCATVDCSRGYVCVASTTTCQAPSAEGTACGPSEPCGFSLTCVTPSGAMTGRCQATGANVGVACDQKQVTGPGCDEEAGLACDGTTSTCIDLAYAAAGQLCGNVSGTVVACDGASECFGASGTTTGTCEALARDGSACDTSAGPGCMSPARCVAGGGAVTAGTCVLPSSRACQ